MENHSFEKINNEEQTEELLEKTSTEDIDELTLSLLMNKNHYKKYVAKNEGMDNIFNKDYLNDNIKYRKEIIELTSRMIDTPDIEISSEIEDIFIAYSKKIVNYLKMKEIEKNNKYNFFKKDEDVMFGEIEENLEQNTSNNSFWSSEKVVKKGGNMPISTSDMRMFSKI